MELASQLRIQARANRLANRRLHAAIATLPEAEFGAARIGFFPSIGLTLNHILAVDEYYVGALHGLPGLVAASRAFVPADSLNRLVPRQTASDERLIAWCDRLDAAGCERAVRMERADHVQTERAAHVLAHLFLHQTHHRGQVHGMLSGTATQPPQLDEFLMPSEAALRIDDMAALGWDETSIFGARL